MLGGGGESTYSRLEYVVNVWMLETPLSGSGRCPRPPIFNTGIPSGTPKAPIVNREDPTLTPMPPVGDNTLPAGTPLGATERSPETPWGANKPPKGTDCREGGVSRYAAMKTVPKKLVKRASISSNPDQRMWSGRRSMGMIGNNTLMDDICLNLGRGCGRLDGHGGRKMPMPRPGDPHQHQGWHCKCNQRGGESRGGAKPAKPRGGE